MGQAESESLSDLKELISIIREQPGVPALRATYGMHRDREDPVDIKVLLSQASVEQVGDFCAAVLCCLPEVSAFGGASNLQDADWEALRIAGEFANIAQGALGERTSPHLGALGSRLHDVLPSAPPQVHRVLLRALTPMLATGADVAENALPALLVRSLGDGGAENERRSPAIVDVKRVYAAHEKLIGMDLRNGGPNNDLRNLLLRCPSAFLYLRVADGKKFLAFLLTLKHLTQGIFDAIMLQLTTARKSQANSIGEVFLLAWRTKGADRFVSTLINIVEKAIVASSEPFATNLRSVLSVFHMNRRLPRMDSMLHRVYGPTLQRHLMVANPLVRRNTVTILCDAYPVHDPEASHPDIENAIHSQTDKILSLLDDPSTLVRTVTVQGVCRILTLYVEVVPASKSKRMIDLITAKLAFDSSSAAVRIAAFEGLKAMLPNHATHELLKGALPRLRPLIHDNVERVRLAFLDLLIQLKKRRIVGLPYFAVVPVSELLLRMPDDSPPVVSRIMELIVTLYFPVEKSGKTQKEIRQLQVRACRSMVVNHPRAASAFYRRIRFYVPPGPLVTFAMSVSSEGINAADKAQSLKESTQEPGKKEPARKFRTAKRKESKKKRAKRSEADQETNTKENEEENESTGATKSRPGASQLLAVAAVVLQSLKTALEKESNRELRNSVDAVYKPSDMKSYLVNRKYPIPTRTAVWKIAGCVSSAKSEPIIEIWRKELRSVGDSLYSTQTKNEKSERLDLLGALISCGIAWDRLDIVVAVIAEWEHQIQDKTFAAAAAKLPQKQKKQKKSKQNKTPVPAFPEVQPSSSRNKALSALIGVIEVLTTDLELREQFLGSLRPASTSTDVAVSEEEPIDGLALISTIRRSCLAAFDNVLSQNSEETTENTSLNAETQLLAIVGLSSTWKIMLLVLSSCPASSQDNENMETALGSRMKAEFGTFLDWLGHLDFFASASASTVQIDFCASFSSIFLAHCADAICLGHLPDSAYNTLVQFVQGVCSALSGQTGANMVRVLSELLRVAYQVGEHSAYVSAAAGVPDNSKEVSSQLVQARDSIAESVLHLISSIQVGADDALSGKQPLLVQSLGELLNSLEKDVGNVAGKAIMVAIDKGSDDAECLLRTLLASVLRRHAMNSNRVWSMVQGSNLLRLCFGSSVERGNFVEAARLVTFATESVFEDGTPLEGPRAVEAYLSVVDTVRDLLNCLTDLSSASTEASIEGARTQAAQNVRNMDQRGKRLCSGEEATPVKAGPEEDDS